jgi:putative phage-type endonuclease
MTYSIVNVTPDTPEWAEERRRSVGASEVPAVMGMSSYGVTPLDVYKSKLGHDRPFDPILGFIGHASEPIMHEWVERYSGLNITLRPGFMARSTMWPFLHATFDRAADGFMVQMKTAHAYTGHHWDEGVPTDIRVQVQSEMAVSGDPHALVVVWIGGREFRYFWEARDDKFIHEYLIPTVEQFWTGHILAGVAPEPSTLAEVNELPTDPGVPTDLSDAAFETLERITVLNSDIAAQEKERDELKVALARYVGTADTLMYQGQKVATWRQQKGRAGFDKRAFAAEHPDLHAEYTTIGAPFRVLRTIKPKDTK